MRQTRHRRDVDEKTTKFRHGMAGVDSLSSSLHRSPISTPGKAVAEATKKPRSPLRRSSRFNHGEGFVEDVNKPTTLRRKSPRLHHRKAAVTEYEKKSSSSPRRSPRFSPGEGVGEDLRKPNTPIRKSPRFLHIESEKKSRSPLRRSPRFNHGEGVVEVVKKTVTQSDKKSRNQLRQLPRLRHGKTVVEDVKKPNTPPRKTPRFHHGETVDDLSANSSDTLVRRDAKECCNAADAGGKNCQQNIHLEEEMDGAQFKETTEVFQEWTNEQELALRKAYFVAKPTPNFWKKVARMVSGKSADECFDKIHSVLPSVPRTPSRAPRSRGIGKKPVSPPSFSASKLLYSAAENRSMKLKAHRRNRIQVHRTVRHLLEKQKDDDIGHEGDFFAVLEPIIDPVFLDFQQNDAFVSPVGIHKSCSLVHECSDASSAYKKHVEMPQGDAAFVSPPVLKQIKNKALHDKYIDQLHCRDAKRRAEWMRSRKHENKKAKTTVNGENKSVKFARHALVVDAQSAISQLRSLQEASASEIDECDSIENEEDHEFC